MTRKHCTVCNSKTGHRHETAPASYVASGACTWEVPNDTDEASATAWACNNCNRLSPRRHHRTAGEIAHDRMKAQRASR